MSFEMVNGGKSRDTVELCEQLLDGAKAGHVIGVAFVALLRRRRFMVDATGEAARDPTLTRGALLALDDELRDLVRAKKDTNTTR